MQISLKWIEELVNIKTINLDYLIEKLTLGGFEVEEILEIELNGKKEIALDISATANRSDSLSIQGISTEIAALLNEPTKNFKYSIKKLNWIDKIENLSLVNKNKNSCQIFVALIIEDLKNYTVPKWLKQKLIQSSIKPLNNLLDFQQYILLETGYPFEFYDLEKIYSKINTSKFNLTISNIHNKENFLANNQINYQLNSSNFTINANELPISIAGIIPHLDFAYSESTKSLLIEGSIFDSTTIRQQSRMLGIRTDRSARYEKSLKKINLIKSLYKLVSLLRISNPNLVCKLHTINQIPKTSLNTIFLDYKNINEILGPIKDDFQNDVNYIKPDLISNYLDRLNFKYNYDDKKLNWEVTIPYLRSDDITREIDLIEEIGRLHGFNNFLTRLPKIITIGKEDLSYKIRKKVTNCLLNLGLNELIHYSLVNKTTFINNEVKLVNPLLSDCSNLRSSLLPTLIKTVSENLKQGNSVIEGFEYGHVFSGDILKEFKEEEYLAGIFGGVKTKLTWSDLTKSLSWFEAKGKIEQLFKQLNLLINWKPYSSSKSKEILHPYCTASLVLWNNKNIGTFGKIHPILAKKLNIPSDLYLFEFDFEILKTEIQMNKLTIYNEYSLYPKIIKDLSFIIKNDIPFEYIKEILYQNGTKFLAEINLLDEYKSKSIPDNHISLCLQLVFQSTNKTLQNKEIEKIINNLEILLNKKFNALIRT